MKTKRSDEYVRLKKVLLQDSLKIPNGVFTVLKTDMTAVLNSYFELTGEADVKIEVEENGLYKITVFAEGKNAKKVKSL